MMVRTCLLAAACLCMPFTAAVLVSAAAGATEDLAPFDDITRSLQSAANLDCKTSGARYTCTFTTVYSPTTEGGGKGNAEVNVNCPVDAALGFWFRKAEGCSCSASVTFNGKQKFCPCSVCPGGYGPNPVSIDCDYTGRPNIFSPLITATCKSYDCGNNCNGVCTKGCAEDPQQCKDQLCVVSSSAEGGRPPARAPVRAPARTPVRAPVRRTPVKPVNRAPVRAPVRRPSRERELHESQQDLETEEKVPEASSE